MRSRWTKKFGGSSDKAGSKYGNVRQTGMSGRNYDSKLERQWGDMFHGLLKQGAIGAVEEQFRCDIDLYNSHGELCHTVRHKVDFLITELDGSLHLVEVKGFETPDWKWRRTLLEKIYLKQHPEITYEIVRDEPRLA